MTLMKLSIIIPVSDDVHVLQTLLRWIEDVPWPTEIIDERTLRQFYDALMPGGRVVLIVPALRWLYGAIDEAAGHYRRYERGEITAKLRRVGFEVEVARFMNVLGIPGWYLNACLLRRRAVPGLQSKINDWLVRYCAWNVM